MSGDSGGLFVVECPVCGGIIEAESLDEVARLARLHTLDAHQYDVPAEHVLARARREGSEAQ